MQDAASLLPPGTPVAHYRLERPLGAGAMGTVYLAHDTALDRGVAVKVLRPEIAGREDLVGRFFREARAAARVNHPNLTHIYFVGESGPLRFFAMEHVPGSTLEARVETGGALDLPQAVDVLVQAARGLAAAHAAGVVHRDVKPSNLLLTPEGILKVTDFGLAKSLEGDPSATAEGAVVGTPQYMSPEQCRGEEASVRSDVYCLGLVAWYLLAGRAPFGGPAIGKVLQDQMSAPLPPLTALREDLPPEVDRLLARMTAKDPVGRPASMEEVAAAWEALRPRPLLLAPLSNRVVALLVDLVAVLAAAAAVSVVGLWLVYGRQVIHLGGDESQTNLAFAIVLALTSWAMLFGLEAWQGATLGKMAFRLQVVRANGGRPTLSQHLVRHLLRWPAFVLVVLPEGWMFDVVPFALQTAAILAGAVCFLAFRGRTFSDLVTRTRVVIRVRHETFGTEPEQNPTF